MRPAVEFQRVSRSFGEILAVDELTLNVERGEVFGLLGHNGAGKTTAIRMMNGVLAPDGGRLTTLGLDPVAQGPELRHRTGVLTEAPSLDDRLSGRENLTVYAHLYAVPQADVPARVAELLARFGLAERAEDKVVGYSKGMKQRLALARSLLHGPELLFLDEPTAGLDPVSAREVHGLIRQLRTEGRTIVLCSHNLVEAQRLCDRVAVIRQGRLLALGSVAELARRIGGGQELEIEVEREDAGRAVEVLRARFDGREIRTERGFIVCEDVERSAIPALMGVLVENGVRVYRVSPQEPSLEDVYFGLHGENRR